MARFCAEVGPLADAGRFLTGPDMGTAEEDFAPLRERRPAPAALRAVVGGVPFEDVLTGYGVAVAAEAALTARWGWGWDGRSVAIEGFGKVGGGVAREVARRGGRVVTVSTVAGASRTRRGWTSSCRSRGPASGPGHFCAAGGASRPGRRSRPRRDVRRVRRGGTGRRGEFPGSGRCAWLRPGMIGPDTVACTRPSRVRAEGEG